MTLEHAPGFCGGSTACFWPAVLGIAKSKGVALATVVSRESLPPRLGLTMVEIVVSVFVFAVALVPLFDLFRRGASTIRMEREHILAVGLASELVDQITCFPFRDVPDVGGVPIDQSTVEEMYLVQNVPSTRLILSHLPNGFSRTLTIESVSKKLKKIKAEVSWGPDLNRRVSCQALMEWSP
jgi:hypothetical protein